MMFWKWSDSGTQTRVVIHIEKEAYFVEKVPAQKLPVIMAKTQKLVTYEK